MPVRIMLLIGFASFVKGMMDALESQLKIVSIALTASIAVVITVLVLYRAQI